MQPEPSLLATLLPRPRRRRRTSVVTGVAAPTVAIILAGAAIVIPGGGSEGPDQPAARHKGRAAPAKVVIHDGASFALGESHDDIAIGDWGCAGAEPTPVLLRRRQGRVLAYREWPGPGQSQAAVFLGRVEGARRLTTTDDDGDGCPELWVERNVGPPVPVVPPVTPPR